MLQHPHRPTYRLSLHVSDHLFNLRFGFEDPASSKVGFESVDQPHCADNYREYFHPALALMGQVHREFQVLSSLLVFPSPPAVGVNWVFQYPCSVRSCVCHSVLGRHNDGLVFTSGSQAQATSKIMTLLFRLSRTMRSGRLCSMGVIVGMALSTYIILAAVPNTPATATPVLV